MGERLLVVKAVLRFSAMSIILGCCLGGFVPLVNVGIVRIVEFLWYSGYSTTTGLFLLLVVFEFFGMLSIGFAYSQKQEFTVLHDFYAFQYKMTVKYPCRPLVSLTLITAAFIMLFAVIAYGSVLVSLV
jgi:hypothetical protein